MEKFWIIFWGNVNLTGNFITIGGHLLQNLGKF